MIKMLNFQPLKSISNQSYWRSGSADFSYLIVQRTNCKTGQCATTFWITISSKLNDEVIVDYHDYTLLDAQEICQVFENYYGEQ